MILVGIGANLPGTDGVPPEANCARALALVEAAGVTVIRRSRWYRSAAWPRSDLPDFVNGVARVATEKSAEALLGLLQDIERRMGRRRGTRNAARIIDLDLLAYGRRIQGAPDDEPSRLRLPHPRLQDRAFVLYPLRDVAPDWTHPASRQSVDEMLAALADDLDCVPIEDSLANMPKFQ